MSNCTIVPANQFSAIYKTKFPELNFQKQGNGNWRFLTSDDNRPVGRQYPSREQLVADTDRYGEFFGCE